MANKMEIGAKKVKESGVGIAGLVFNIWLCVSDT
ncbi:uncharacterized protein G2W53_035543 [Senna tora]|uniref:Uncharacterized protein n=1 Tax=Senna tora TaxID=362788 RepID=A0A834SU67_9FABA|nr:uncharacterized protein G2W53_035543 [Senna tora]